MENLSTVTRNKKWTRQLRKTYPHCLGVVSIIIDAQRMTGKPTLDQTPIIDRDFDLMKSYLSGNDTETVAKEFNLHPFTVTNRLAKFFYTLESFLSAGRRARSYDILN